MRKVFVLSLALISFGSLLPASAEPPTVEALCTYAATRCTNNCLDDKNYKVCLSDCDEGFHDCVHNHAQIQIRKFTKGSAGGNTKDIPGGASSAAADPNSHALGATTNGMSVNPGAATAPAAAASSTNGGAVTNSGTISTANNGSAVTNTGVNSGRNGVAGGGNGLLSRPGMPRLKAQ